MGVLILDFLTSQQWIKEDILAEKLQLHSKQVRRVVRYLEQEQLVMREHVRHTVSKKVEAGTFHLQSIWRLGKQVGLPHDLQGRCPLTRPTGYEMSHCPFTRATGHENLC